ncbi:hypothetical protein [Paraburkholderia sp. CNPSo 3281]|uniref:hypothetical protein n=1 Tax=Paraburkholderia sp. CNPSo 3281 TaxID=2940933 RepID=UPI0020B70C58|nr:hypothetical protein [Paraburkholderia sp. CNPSo 3281]MCP3717667.1 hypothetical protein [Paraburkholderia sp. CNPSo 3281]
MAIASRQSINYPKQTGSAYRNPPAPPARGTGFSASNPRPATPLVVIEIAQQIGPAPFAPVVSGDTNCGYYEHDRAGSHTQPGLVHVSLLGSMRIATQL